MSGAILEFAKTGRSKCATTGVAIEQGSPRVGFEIWRMGRRCMTYQTPKAFLKNLQLGVVLKKGSKCKFSGVDLAPGDLYVVFTMGGSKGEKATSQSCKLDKVSAFLSDVIQAAGGSFPTKSMTGFKALSSAGQQKVTKALSASGKGSASSEKKAASSKRPAAASSLSTKRAKK